MPEDLPFSHEFYKNAYDGLNEIEDAFLEYRELTWHGEPYDKELASRLLFTVKTKLVHFLDCQLVNERTHLLEWIDQEARLRGLDISKKANTDMF